MHQPQDPRKQARQDPIGIMYKGMAGVHIMQDLDEWPSLSLLCRHHECHVRTLSDQDDDPEPAC